MLSMKSPVELSAGFNRFINVSQLTKPLEGINMKIDVLRLSDQEIVELQQQLELEVVRREKERRREALRAAEAAAGQYGFKLQELLVKTKRSGRSPIIKYRHPEKSELTWSGMGRKPKWIAAALELGYSLEEMQTQ